MEIIEIIKYFGRVPSIDGVLKNFARDDNKVPGYMELYNDFQELTPNSLIPEIADYVISSASDNIINRISNISGYFLLVEPSGIAIGALDNIRNRESKFAIQLTIAHHWDSRTLDGMAEMLIQDKCLALAIQLIELMRNDDENLCPIKRWLDNPFQLDPIEPHELAQSIGWQLTINPNYNALL